MLFGGILVLCVASVLAVPTSVEWMKIEPVNLIHGQVKEVKDAVAPTSYHPYDGSWNDFKLVHKKQYDATEEPKRFNIFMENVKKIELHNQLYHDGKKSYYLGVNEYADLEFEEYKKLNGFKARINGTESGCSTFLTSAHVSAPSEVDWRKEGYVTPVKNQGQCGSCWSFSTTGSLEGQTFRKTKQLVSLSEQQLVDCSAKFGNEGCNGGLMDNAFLYVKSVGGIDSESEYPYEAKVEYKCNFKKADVVADCTGCVDVTSGSESALKEAVATVGPISIAIDASHQSFQLYKGGVYDEPECSSTQLDHGVLIVGYGTLDGSDYWIVKNSWGETWGKDGYVLMSRNKDNQCGVATQASYPLV
ncbi:procathepsin L [Patella vulgata]|uniref:procathepsin L n=1 Tax=Patella vulgata TaxID=6465 RepID=UPI00217FBD4D|nr:procathepsin L [Patella vulgata]XP_050394897.1 procathepsin L [Patella vulgata]